MHKAVIRREAQPDILDEDQWWASLDGEVWLPVNREPMGEDTDAVGSLFDKPDGEGFLPMRFARRWLQFEKAEFIEGGS